jgi:prepilin-type N-terminal cleavage/methylation domain-containing protein
MLTVRRGVTLIELIVVMAIGGLALGLITSISLREQRIFGDLAEREMLSGQLREASAILPIDLRAAATGSNDVREARDTSIELRGTIASAVVCDTGANSLVLTPVVAGPQSFSAGASSVDAGDTAWVLTPVDSGDDWMPFRVSAATTVTAGQCSAGGPLLSDADQRAARVAIVLAAPPPLAPLVGMPLRVTRPLRLSLYRASDGGWYLGERDWSATSQRFNTIQPVSGPFLSAALGGLVFRYQDSAGVVLPTPVSVTRSIALIQVALKGQTRSATRVLGAPSTTGKRTDSALISVLVRNRR